MKLKTIPFSAPDITENDLFNVNQVIRSGLLTHGKYSLKLEDLFCEFTGAKFATTVSNCTAGLHLSCLVSGFGPGDEVIIPSNTFIATAMSAVRCGASIVMVDCDDEYQLMDPTQVGPAITDRTKAIIPVHLFGQVAPMEAIGHISGDSGVPVVEDAAQAHGAAQDGRNAGQFGVAASWSFYPGKNLGAYGDGGGVTMNDEKLRDAVIALRNYGSAAKYEHPGEGYNSRLDTLQAVVLRAKLKRLADWNAARRAAAARYDDLLKDIEEVRTPKTMPQNTHVFHLYPIRVQNRDGVLAQLHEQGIGAGIHYPKALHLQGAFAHLGHKEGEFPNAENAAATMISLPMFPEITEQQQARVVECLKNALSSAVAG